MMTEKQFDAACEAQAELASTLANHIDVLNKSLNADVGEAKRYLALARTAAQESELWLGKSMVAFASGGR